MQSKSSLSRLLPVLFGFFIMGFVDVVGISANYVKKDFDLSDTLANLLPMMVFLWFLVFAVPAGVVMNSLGRKKTVILSMVITFVAMLVPLFSYHFGVVLVAFALLGIGNTILQVSLNPLMTNVVRGELLTSSLTWGQFIKAIAAFLGPVIAGFAASSLGNWKLIFPIFAAVTLLSMLWLMLTAIPENHEKSKTSSFGASFGLLRDPMILVFFLGILAVVGIDVGLNITVPKFLMERCDIALEQAGLGTSLYFIARTSGTFIGAILLAKMAPRKFFITGVVVAMAGTLAMLPLNNVWAILVMVFLVGFALANVFSIIFSAALQRNPSHSNEISGLMVMGISGGAVIPPLMGVVADHFGQTGGMVILLAAMGYLLFCALRMQHK